MNIENAIKLLHPVLVDLSLNEIVSAVIIQALNRKQNIFAFALAELWNEHKEKIAT